MSKPQKSLENTPQKKSFEKIWDYIASAAFIIAGSYFLATQRPGQGAVYILVGVFFIFITKFREKKKK